MALRIVSLLCINSAAMGGKADSGKSSARANFRPGVPPDRQPKSAVADFAIHNWAKSETSDLAWSASGSGPGQAPPQVGKCRVALASRLGFPLQGPARGKSEPGQIGRAHV